VGERKILKFNAAAFVVVSVIAGAVWWFTSRNVNTKL
jgi:hypothetical protein